MTLHMRMCECVSVCMCMGVMGAVGKFTVDAPHDGPVAGWCGGGVALCGL